MNRERAKELLPVIQAFAAGKTIQVLSYTGKWSDIENMQFYDNNKYRIKPESHLRPYTFEEMCEAIKEHGGYIVESSGVFIDSISCFGTEGIILPADEEISYSELCEYTWLDDNSPCGVIE